MPPAPKFAGARSDIRAVTYVLGELEGVLSVDDVLERLTGQLRHVTGSIRSEQGIERALRP